MWSTTRAMQTALKNAKSAHEWLTSGKVEKPTTPKQKKRVTQAATLIGMAVRLLEAEDATLDQLSLIVPTEAGRIAGCHKTTILRALKDDKLPALTAESEGSVERGTRAVNVLLRLDVEEVMGTKGLNSGDSDD